jgi:hypothetical protein
VGPLGWFDRWFASPSNHRVHHAVNERYIDRNYGGILMVWDRLFGTFVEEDEKCVYGTRAPLESWDPLWANLEVYADLARKSRAHARWRYKCLVWIKPPGWRPTGPVQASASRPAFDLAQVRTYDPAMSRGVRVHALVHLALAIAGTLPLLWLADQLPKPLVALWAAAIIGVLWLTGAVMQGRMRLSHALWLEGTSLLLGLAATGVTAAMY